MSIIIIRKTPKTIVKPEPVVEVKPTTEAALVRYYPDGTMIPAPLPMSYAMAETNIGPGVLQKHCGNCKAFAVATNMCLGYNAMVKPTYVCATWQPIA